MAKAGLVIGLVVAIVVAIFLIFCCFRSITKDKEKLMRQIKQVRGVNDVDIDDIEASAPPSEEHPPGTKEYDLNGQDADKTNAVFAYSQQQEGVESEGR